MAKADGAVTRDEVAAFGEVFQVPPGEEEHVRLVFDLARKSTAGFEAYARQVGRLFADERVVLEDLLGGLFHIALADGLVCSAEDDYLREVARHFGFDAADYTRIRALHVGPQQDAAENPYAILGVLPGTAPGAIRKAYHRLVRESHPDLVIAQGLPPECVALATARIARINAAYEQIAKGEARPE
jgi:DnaJ like chaperone protein